MKIHRFDSINALIWTGVKNLALLISVGFASSSIGWGAETRSVTVQGACNRMVTPDRGSVTLVAQARDKDLKAASRRVTDLYEKIKTSVNKLKLSELELRTSEYNLREDREWVNGKSIFKGFIARMGLFVSTSEIPRLGEILEIGAREGVEEIGSLSTFLSDERLAKEQLSCLDEAAKNARTKAEKLAQALGARVGAVRTLSETAINNPVPRPMESYGKAMLMADGESSAPARVDAGKQSIAFSVFASFELE